MTVLTPAPRANLGAARMRALVRGLTRPLTLVSLLFVLALVVLSVLAPLIVPFDPLATDPRSVLQGPSGAHWLGTDATGRDVLSRLLAGGNESLLAPLLALVVAAVIGIPIGLLGGYAGRWVDRVLSVLTDILLAVPGIVVLLTVVAVVGRSTFATMIALGVLMSPNFMLLTRNATVGVTKELYIDAARVAGFRAPRIAVRHVLPNIASPLIVQASLTFAIALLISAGLGFLGLGAAPPAPTWGGMVADASAAYSRNPWLLVPTGGIITLTALALNLLGNGLRDAATDRTGAEARGRRPSARSAAELPGDELTIGAADAPLLHVDRLSVSFPVRGQRTPVVSPLSFTIRRGETVALVGESGSGKTITALSLLGLLASGGRIDSGSVWFGGVDTVVHPEQLEKWRGSRMGYVSQDPMLSLDPNFSVLSQLTEPIRRHLGLNRRDARARAIELLASVGLADPESVAAKFPHQLSGGMAQRVSIAIGICADPELLIADEPTTALDVTTQAEILDLLRRLQAERDMALLLVTHDLGVVADLCDTAIVLYAGQVVEYSSTPALFARKYHPYTSALLRSDPHLAAVGEPLPALQGTVVAPQDWPVGCRLAARCPLAVEACRAAPIPLARVVDDRLSRCIRPDEADALGEGRAHDDAA